jgi:hypothetical protein
MKSDTLIFTVAQGSVFERMASNLFRTIKNFNEEAVTACLSPNKPNLCDIHVLLDRDINDFCLEGQSYSFKLGSLLSMKDILKDFKKLIYLDSDCECVDKMHFDESIYQSDFYSAWCQSIVTENEEVSSRINRGWSWQGQTFQRHEEFAKENGFKEWKNVNGGLIVISCEKIELICDAFKKWTHKIKNFYGRRGSNDELVLSIILADMYPEYKTPDICRNGICQLNMSHDPRVIRQEKKFMYEPWFNSSGSTLVKATCVHSPGWKELLGSVP